MKNKTKWIVGGAIIAVLIVGSTFLSAQNLQQGFLKKSPQTISFPNISTKFPLPTERNLFENIVNLTKNIEQHLSPQVNPSILKHCYVDNQLKIGAYRHLLNIDAPHLEILPSTNLLSCKESVLDKNYRFAKHYFSTAEFAIVCTDPCSIDDSNFFKAAFEGHILGINKLKEKIGYLPKNKIEFHLGQDGDCFVNGYGDNPTGYTALRTGNPYICNATYYQYLKYRDHPNPRERRDLEYYRSIESQILTIHEPIHIIFHDYHQSAGNRFAPEYKIQESFCKGISLFATGKISRYGERGWIGVVHNLENIPEENNPNINNFFVYSLNQRFGFNEDEDTLRFFELYKEKESMPIDGNSKVKMILDEILETDTQESFNDVGIYLN
jgi:hypothetical protein